MQKRLLALYSVGHFTVDLACAYLMLTLVSQHGDLAMLCLVIYNFCAFALQMPVGLIADVFNRNSLVAVAGFAFTLLAFACSPLPILCAAVLGIGNCLFHVGGGIDVLHFSDTKQWMLGVFVSPGAVGLYLGGLLARQQLVSLPIGFVSLLAVMAVLVIGLQLTRSLRRRSENSLPSITPTGGIPWLAFLALFLVVVLRSYAGSTQSFDWKAGVWVPLSVVGLALGKVAGGFLADGFGAMRASLVTLSLSTVLYIFSANPVCGLLSIFLFNMTMPLTLFAMARLFPGARGFAFGSLTFAIFLGYLPTGLSLPVPFAGCGWWYAVEALVSLLLLLTGLWACRPRGEPHV